MLDQNTDRMWYVIGAVLVGAAIILIANGTLPQMFASVTDSFQRVYDNIEYPNVDNKISLADLKKVKGASSTGELSYNYDSSSKESHLSVAPDYSKKGHYYGVGWASYIPVNAGDGVEYSIDIYADEKYSLRMDLNNQTDLNPGVNEHMLETNGVTNLAYVYFDTVPNEWVTVTGWYIASDFDDSYREASSILYVTGDNASQPSQLELKFRNANVNISATGVYD